MFEWLSQSLWGFPVIAAIHVAGLVWFGAVVLAGKEEIRNWKRLGLAMMVVTGLLLFGMHPARYAASPAFRLKLLLLAAVLGIRLPRPVSLILWIAVLLAARGIAYF